MPKIYLDHNATTPLASEAYEAMKPYLEGWVGNASSLHWAGESAKAALEKARGQVAHLIGALPKEILFTSGATESINAVLKGLFPPHRRKKNHLIISDVEHHATLDTAETLASWGVDVDIVPVDTKGRIDPEEIEKRFKEETGLVSVMWANNEIGNIYPIDEIVSQCHASGIPVHVDAAQAVGKIVIDVRKTPVDFLSFSSHKIYGPQGVGAIFIRHDRKLRRFHDGGAQERERRGGTENIGGIVGFGEAADLARYRLQDDGRHHQRLLQRLEEGIRIRFPEALVYGDSENRLPNTLNVHFPGLQSEALLIALDLEGIAVSSGSACTSGTVEPSHVLMAMGLTTEQAQSAIRFSLGRGNTMDEIDYLLQILPSIIHRLKAA
jgi:cysteine desulfurase